MPILDLTTFDHRTPTEEQLTRIEIVREEFKRIGSVFARFCPDSRHRSLAFTYLEIACMLAVKSIVCEDQPT